MLSPHPVTRLTSRKLVTLERSGRYEEALECFGSGWADDGFLPPDGLLVNYSECLLRYGGLLGFYGYKCGLATAQERSRNILTLAHEQFVEQGDVDKIVECENYIALSYWRSGEFREALVWVDEALSRNLPSSNGARLYTEVIRSLVFLHTGQIEENIANCTAVEEDMRKHGDAFLNGCLCTNLALSYKRVFRNADSLEYLVLARYFHEKSGHKIYLGTVHNNLAQLFKVQGKFESAHEAADSAIRIYKKIKDRTREGSTWDTKAQIYLSERKVSEALGAAQRSIKLLQTIPGSADLAESFLTKAKILLLDGSFSEAILSLVDAINITRVQNGDDATKVVIEDFEAALKENRTPLLSPQVDPDELELVVPASISSFADYKGVWITNKKLENVGIPSGSLAIVIPGPVSRGELIAVLERKNSVVSCGFYDSEFGIICLESDDNDPELFMENEIEVLGKIVGVCRSGKGADGKMIVEPLTF